MTRDSVPSMLLGLPLYESEYLREGMLYRRQADGPWLKLSESDNVFRKLALAGHPVSVTGWNLSYCNSFPTLANCADNSPYEVPGEHVGLWDWMYFSNWLARKLAYDAFNRQLSKLDVYADMFFNWHYRNDRRSEILGRLADNFLDAIRSRKYGLVFAHLPVPHLPRVDWQTGVHNHVDLMSDYEFNLKYCDELLKRMLAALGSSGYSEGYVVVITSDHWYRSLDWLQQGRAQVWPKARRGVPLIVYSSRDGAPQGTTVDKSFSTTGLGPVVETMVMNRVGSNAQIAALLGNLKDHDTILRNF